MTLLTSHTEPVSVCCGGEAGNVPAPLLQLTSAVATVFNYEQSPWRAWRYSFRKRFSRQPAKDRKVVPMERTPAFQSAQKTILVVDDEPTVLAFVSEFLGANYNVLTATSGTEALQQSKDFEDEIHLLLSDFRLPGVTGVDLATEIAVQRPNIKVLLMSGYTGGMLALKEGWHFLAKPFIPSQLRTSIADLISPAESGF